MPVTERELSCDVLVAGGGLSGVCCALAAARIGVRVILCQDRPVLGGNASSEVRMHVVGANGVGGSERGAEGLTEAREGGLIEEIRLENAVHNPQRSASVFDLILYDKCRVEPNLQLLLNTTVTAAHKQGRRVVAVQAERPSTEERLRISASVFVDCTGDGRLGLEAGAAFLEGREAHTDFGESLAPEQADRLRLGSTILLQAKKHPQPMPFTPPRWIRQFSEEELRLRLYATPGDEAPTHEYGYWWAEWGGQLDTIADNETIRDELLAITLGIWNHIKNGPAAARFQADHWALEWIGFLPGKRESRRFLGQHLLTEHDILASREFSDAIAYGGWTLDLHPPQGIDAADLPPCEQHAVPYLYDIPLRACVARDLENLMFAGRNISATHVGFSSTRVMATCAAMGQGVGTAAAISAQKSIPPDQLVHSTEALQAVQRRLLWDDAFLIGRPILAATDPLHRARITASSEQPQGRAEQIRSPQSRCVHGARGVVASRREPGSHRWMSDPACGWPAWIQLEWDEPQSISQVRLIFDTGLHRHLTLSHHDGYTAKMQWGHPQPETVRDYDLDCHITATGWQTLAQVRGNYQRLNQHTLPDGSRVTALKITVHSTNGIDHARLISVMLTEA